MVSSVSFSSMSSSVRAAFRGMRGPLRRTEVAHLARSERLGREQRARYRGDPPPMSCDETVGALVQHHVEVRPMFRALALQHAVGLEQVPTVSPLCAGRADALLRPEA